jgi:hypothetical protein
MKADSGFEVQLHALLTLELDGVVSLRPQLLYPGEKHWRPLEPHKTSPSLQYTGTIFILLTGSTALRLTAADVPLGATRIRILPADTVRNQVVKTHIPRSVDNADPLQVDMFRN